MGKISDFFLRFKTNYDARRVREVRMDRFLDKAEENNKTIQGVIISVEKIGGQVTDLQTKVDNLQSHMTHIDGKLAIIGEGTKMELFDTLYNWKKILVDERGWASAAEKKEVKDIYEVYHEGLKGNGQGKVYFEQIMNLPENPPTK